MSALLDSARTLSPWITGPVAFAIWVAVLVVLQRVVISRIRAFADRSASEIDDVIVFSISRPLTLLILGSGFLLLSRILPLSPGVDRGFGIAFGVLALFAVILFIDRLVRGLIGFYAPRVDFLRTSKTLLVGTTRALVILTALFILLANLGVSITPLVASLGIGSLAVALALKDTLANFFAGIQVLIDKPVAVGNFVKLDSGEDGYVTKVGWRSTHIRMIPNNLVIVPNSKLIDSVIRNYSLPQDELTVRVQVGVHYASDLEKVEKITCEVGKQIMQTTEGAFADFEPYIRYHTFADFSINFMVILKARTFWDSYRVKHEFIKLLQRRFKEEGIVIPFPIRTLDFEKEDLAALAGKKGG
ncbi:MAG: mechanosensitive ion channel family protein [Candidatus Eiseniibacteriota bacterium]|nr:MAG: mechanosensitive ion channel family protein [Candidatus Eisenbacteria bacterium]